jgi:hypothetical protein
MKYNMELRFSLLCAMVFFVMKTTQNTLNSISIEASDLSTGASRAVASGSVKVVVQ